MSCVNNESVRKLRRLFDLYDTNSDDGINIIELDIVLRYLNQTASVEQLKKLFTDVDLDDSGKINFPEFCAFMGIDSETISEEKVDNKVDDIVKKSFNMFDTDKNGIIDLNELQQLVEFLDQKRTKLELLRIVSSIDEDNSGTINLLEFQQLLTKTANSDSEEEIKFHQAFAQIDKDTNGFLSIYELYAELTKGGEEITPLQAKEAFDVIDVSKDGRVDFEEFVKITK